MVDFEVGSGGSEAFDRGITPGTRVKRVGSVRRAAYGRQIGVFAVKFMPLTADNTRRAAAV